MVCNRNNLIKLPDVFFPNFLNLVLDYCFGNLLCGKHGKCVNIIGTFKCSCSFFFDDILCDKCKRDRTLKIY